MNDNIQSTDVNNDGYYDYSVMKIDDYIIKSIDKSSLLKDYKLIRNIKYDRFVESILKDKSYKQYHQGLGEYYNILYHNVKTKRYSIFEDDNGYYNKNNRNYKTKYSLHVNMRMSMEKINHQYQYREQDIDIDIDIDKYINISFDIIYTNDDFVIISPRKLLHDKNFTDNLLFNNILDLSEFLKYHFIDLIKITN